MCKIERRLLDENFGRDVINFLIENLEGVHDWGDFVKWFSNLIAEDLNKESHSIKSEIDRYNKFYDSQIGKLNGNSENYIFKEMEKLAKKDTQINQELRGIKEFKATEYKQLKCLLNYILDNFVLKN